MTRVDAAVPLPPLDDPVTALALAAASGDPAAADALVHATQLEVWRFVASLTSPDEADDLTQDTYLRAFKALPGFAARATARTWLLAIARRVCADHVHSVVRQRQVHHRLRHAPREAAIADTGGGYAVTDLLRTLAEERRVAFALTQVVGLSYAEAAEVIGVPVGTVRSRVARARADLVDAVRAAHAG